MKDGPGLTRAALASGVSEVGRLHRRWRDPPGRLAARTATILASGPTRRPTIVLSGSNLPDTVTTVTPPAGVTTHLPSDTRAAVSRRQRASWLDHRCSLPKSPSRSHTSAAVARVRAASEMMMGRVMTAPRFEKVPPWAKGPRCGNELSRTSAIAARRTFVRPCRGFCRSCRCACPPAPHRSRHWRLRLVGRANLRARQRLGGPRCQP